MANKTIPLMEPAAAIDGAMIRRLVEAFYDKVLRDPDIGPFFAAALADHWERHLATMVDFWSSVALRTGTYGGKPHVVHAPLGLAPQHFGRWLSLFEATAREICPPEAAAFFVDRAHRIAESLQIGLGIGPKALRLPATA